KMASASDELMSDFDLNFDAELPEELVSIENLILDEDVEIDEDEEIHFDVEPIIVGEDIIQEADELEMDIESESANSEICIVFTSDTDVAIVKPYTEIVEHKQETKKKPNLYCKHCGKQYVIKKYLIDHEESCGSKSTKNLSEWRSNIQEHTLSFFKNAVREAAKDRIFILKKESVIHQLIKYLTSKLEENDNAILIYFKQFTIFMLQCVPDHPSKIESCTFKLEEVFSSKTIWKFWRQIFKDFPESKELRILLHYILHKLHKQIWNYRNNLVENRPETKALSLKLTLQEENILRYVAGYIPYVLLKKLEDRKESDSKTALLLVLHSWSQEQGGKVIPFLEYTRSWTEKINRGGAYVINDEFYIFIRRLENVIRTVLNRNLMVHYAGEDLRPLIFEKMDKSSLVRMSWDSLTKDLSDSLSNYLKSAVFKIWTNVRANAFIKAWVTIIKLKKEQ
uniref:Uncharacterized protein n=2 Tax=Clytia hemisphaerica TaxID=252671 RepID=A0A7M5WVV8_9CNID